MNSLTGLLPWYSPELSYINSLRNFFLNSCLDSCLDFRLNSSLCNTNWMWSVLHPKLYLPRPTLYALTTFWSMRKCDRADVQIKRQWWWLQWCTNSVCCNVSFHHKTFSVWLTATIPDVHQHCSSSHKRLISTGQVTSRRTRRTQRRHLWPIPLSSYSSLLPLRFSFPTPNRRSLGQKSKSCFRNQLNTLWRASAWEVDRR